MGREGICSSRSTGLSWLATALELARGAEAVPGSIVGYAFCLPLGTGADSTGHGFRGRQSYRRSGVSSSFTSRDHSAFGKGAFADGVLSAMIDLCCTRKGLDMDSPCHCVFGLRSRVRIGGFVVVVQDGSMFGLKLGRWNENGARPRSVKPELRCDWQIAYIIHNSVIDSFLNSQGERIYIALLNNDMQWRCIILYAPIGPG